MYKHPGVYIEDIPSGLLAIEAASTSTALFIGELPRGPFGEPVLVTSVSQYVSQFGSPWGAAIWPGKTGEVDLFGHAVTAFFANGGSKAWIKRLGTKGDADAKPAKVSFPNRFDLAASEPGTWANDYVAMLTPNAVLAPEGGDATVDAAKGYTLSIGIKKIDDPKALADIDVYETFTPVSLTPADDNFVVKAVKSKVFAVTAAAQPDGGAPLAPVDVPAGGQLSTEGERGTDLAKEDIGTAFEMLRDYRDISIIVMPGLTWDKDKTEIQKALTHAEFMKNCMVIVDPGLTTPLNSAKNVADLGVDTSPFAALYYPWLKVPNPHYDPELASGRDKTVDVPPSGFAAGMWARIDSSRGVWKAPAGLEATVRGTVGPTRVIGNDIQDMVNELGVNVIRSVIGPTVIWGARTLATRVKPEFRYISVRRTQSMIGESLYGALQAVVFEPNDHKLWSSLRGSVGDFMGILFKAGAFQGEKASDAYFVRCGLGSTMDQADIDAGVVRVVVGFAPLKPAEFVVVQIQQIVGQRG